MANTEVTCPKCGSNQLTANKKGFSGTKAVIGGALTLGIGVLAGTIGSNTVVITCMACGKRFKPGEGKIVTIATPESVKPISPEASAINLKMQEWQQKNPAKSINEYFKEEEKLKQQQVDANQPKQQKISFKEWQKENPTKTLNDYFREEGT